MIPPLRLICRLLALLGLSLLVACLPSGSGSSSGGAGSGGSAGDSFYLESLTWGRLVNVVDKDGVLAESDIVVRADLTLGNDFALSNNSATEAEVLTVLNFTASEAGFTAMLAAAQAGLDTPLVKGLNDNAPFSMIPRNAAIRLQFSVPLDENSVHLETVQFHLGNNHDTPFQGRFIVRSNLTEGKGILILDSTISSRESTALELPHNTSGFAESLDSVSDNFLLSIPTTADLTDFQSYVLLGSQGERLSARTDGSDPTSLSSAGHDVLVRSLRTGNYADVNHGFLKDSVSPSILGIFSSTLSTISLEGFDLTKNLNVPLTDGNWVVDYTLNETACNGIASKKGDIIELDGGAVLVVIEDDLVGTPFSVRATLFAGSITLLDLDGIPGVDTPPLFSMAAKVSTRYTDADEFLQTCYLEISPAPGTFPAQDCDQMASITVNFDEPLDPSTVLSMRTMVLTAYGINDEFPAETAPFRDDTVPSGHFINESTADYINRQRGYHYPPDMLDLHVASAEFGGRIHFGPIEVSDGGRRFLLQPSGGFTAPDGQNDPGEEFFALALRDGADGLLDLAGNPLNTTAFVAGSSGGLPMAITATSLSTTSRYFSLLGGSADENGDGMSEYGGQFSIGNSTLGGRPIQHFSRTADLGNEYVSAQISIGAENCPYEPLNPFGAVVMNLWRPGDFGFGSASFGTAFDEPNEFNLNIEGLSWSPVGGIVIDESYPRVSLALSHAMNIPDEVRDNGARSIYPFSGLSSSKPFLENMLGWNEGQTESFVFDAGYTLRKRNVFSADSGAPMLPWPDFENTFTWRDTAIFPTITGGEAPQEPLGFPLGPAGSMGSPPWNMQSTDNLGTSIPLWEAGSVPSVGLPLLARFRCYPFANMVSQNRFQVSQMVTNSALPGWRIFSGGGVSSSGETYTVIPDIAAFGGTWPTGGWLNGAHLAPIDNWIYWAQADFVVQVSRLHTHWFDLGAFLLDGGFTDLIVEPSLAFQAPNTSIVLEFRGAQAVTHGGVDPLTEPSVLTDAAHMFDYYGEDLSENSAVGVAGPWTDDFSNLETDGVSQYRFFQIRISFVGNAEDDLPAELDGLGIAYNLNPTLP